ncbi:MAG TPA: D-glycerate dehydrogenase [Actinomycetes bacterium]|nr:D-glycerate dehydrogenase [Actinomycetes bacterium]
MDVPVVLVTRRVPEPVLERLSERCRPDVWEGEGVMPRAELLDRVVGKAGVMAMLTDRVDGELLDRAGPSLRVVANFAVGYDNLDLDACTERGVMATNTPDVVTEATADLTWALLLAAARRVAEGDRFMRSGRPWIWGPEFFLGREVHGKTLGVVGLGRIGRAVARRAAGFGMPVLYHAGHRMAPDREAALGVAWLELDELLAEADFVTIHTGLTPATRHLIGEPQLRRMKPSAVLVNTARGPIVDEAALARALRDGEIGAAGLDVFEREPEVHPDLLGLDNVTLLPHLGTATIETRVAMGTMAADNLLAALAGRRPPNLLNPGAWERQGAGSPPG